MAGDITSLAFIKDRMELAGPNGNMINRVRANDRTVALVKKWLELSASLRANRAETMTCLEARPGKGDSVTLAIVDKERFATLQATIEADTMKLAAIEDAIRKLDSMGELWYNDVEGQVQIYGRVEFSENQRLNNLASAVLSRKMNTGKPSEQILAEDEEYQRFKGIAEREIKNANDRLSKTRPVLAEMKAILEAAGE